MKVKSNPQPVSAKAGEAATKSHALRAEAVEFKPASTRSDQLCADAAEFVPAATSFQLCPDAAKFVPGAKSFIAANSAGWGVSHESDMKPVSYSAAFAAPGSYNGLDVFKFNADCFGEDDDYDDEEEEPIVRSTKESCEEVFSSWELRNAAANAKLCADVGEDIRWEVVLNAMSELSQPSKGRCHEVEASTSSGESSESDSEASNDNYAATLSRMQRRVSNVMPPPGFELF